MSTYITYTLAANDPKQRVLRLQRGVYSLEATFWRLHSGGYSLEATVSSHQIWSWQRTHSLEATVWRQQSGGYSLGPPDLEPEQYSLA